MDWVRSLSAWARHHRWQLVALVVWLVVLWLVQRYMVAEQLSIGTVGRAVGEVLRTAFWGPFILLALYAVRPLTLVPSSLLSIVAGSVFGVFPGLIYALFGGVVSALPPYFLGFLLSTRTKSDPVVNNTPMIRSIVQQVQQHPFQAVFISRLLYPPYDVANFIFGTLKVAFLPFVSATLAGNIVGALGYVGVGASLEGDVTEGSLQLDGQLLLLSFALLAASFGIMFWLRSRPNSSKR